MYKGTNLLLVDAPPKEPAKCALKLMDILFSLEELQNHTFGNSKKSLKPALDDVRVGMLLGKCMWQTDV